MEIVIPLLSLPIGIWIMWTLFVIVGDMAEIRGQDRLLWQISALFINPFGAMLLLALFCGIKDSSPDP
ncbi:hypothetical protein [Litorivita pollutaquae]|uniref:hypothetical protein n=1 Tax=Litorivita pollutaquae TaxID=2200892 RepID=UPI0013A62D9A|nr:hypothetical protein [Litorivita pollutaquae]